MYRTAVAHTGYPGMVGRKGASVTARLCTGCWKPTDPPPSLISVPLIVQGLTSTNIRALSAADFAS